MRVIQKNLEVERLNSALISAISKNHNNINYAIQNSRTNMQEDQEKLIMENKEFKRLLGFSNISK